MPMAIQRRCLPKGVQDGSAEHHLLRQGGEDAYGKEAKVMPHHALEQLVVVFGHINLEQLCG